RSRLGRTVTLSTGLLIASNRICVVKYVVTSNSITSAQLMLLTRLNKRCLQCSIVEEFSVLLELWRRSSSRTSITTSAPVLAFTDGSTTVSMNEIVKITEKMQAGRYVARSALCASAPSKAGKYMASNAKYVIDAACG